MSILEDLSTLSPRKLEKRLAQLASEALPCIAIWPAEASRADGLTVALEVDARSRPDVADLGRVLEEEPAALLSSAWAVLAPSARSQHCVLILRVSLERPVNCDFAVAVHVAAELTDPMRRSLPLLLAAERFALVTASCDRRPALWFAAPAARRAVQQLLQDD